MTAPITMADFAAIENARNRLEFPDSSWYRRGPRKTPAQKKSIPCLGISDIKAVVADWFRIRALDLEGADLRRYIARPRQIAYHMAREFCGKTYPAIGQEFGGRHHTTIMHGERKIIDLVKFDAKVAYAVQAIRERLYQRAAQ